MEKSELASLIKISLYCPIAKGKKTAYTRDITHSNVPDFKIPSREHSVRAHISSIASHPINRKYRIERIEVTVVYILREYNPAWLSRIHLLLAS